ncbi:MAG: hypothetical protein ACYSPJ_07485 [Planctomycetota bacterium]|jgi:hypothetical protein
MFQLTVFKTLRFARVLLISFASTIWILPFYLSIMFLLLFLERIEPILLEIEPEMFSFSNVEFSQHYFIVSTIILFIITFFWTFVAANKLWPINKKGDTQ